VIALSRGQIDDWVGGRLRALLDEAVHAPYYREVRPPRAPTHDPFAQLGSWPVLTRKLVRERFDDLLSGRFSRGALIFSTTGGSTGDPMPFARDAFRQQLARVDQELGYGWAGRPPGGRSLNVWGSSLDLKRDRSRWRKVWSQYVRGEILLDAFEMPGDAEEWVRSLDRWRPDVLVGYAGALDRFAGLCLTQGYQPRWVPSGLVASAETLSAEARGRIEEAFRAPVFDRYASRELGFVAHECRAHRGLHVFEHGKIVEILGPDDRRLPEGESGRIVVTDLWNTGFPMVRYDTEDVGRLVSGPCPCSVPYRRLEAIEGRVTDFLVGQDGQMVSGLLLPHLLKDVEPVERFRVVQSRSGDVEVQVVVRIPLSHAERDTIREILARYLSDVDIRIKEVDRLLIPSSGKHRIVISELARVQFSGQQGRGSG
jgi:phenylacetate-CoA ligase